MGIGLETDNSSAVAAIAPQPTTGAGDIASLEAFILTLPELPLIPLTSKKYECGAEYLAMTGGCHLPIVCSRQCQELGCTRLVHLQCERMWEDFYCFIGIHPDNKHKPGLPYCVEHHQSAKDLLMIPSEDISNNIDKINNTKQKEAKENDDKEASLDNSNDDDYKNLTKVGNCESSNEEGKKINKHNKYLKEVRGERLEHFNSNYIGDYSNNVELFTKQSGDIA